VINQTLPIAIATVTVNGGSIIDATNDTITVANGTTGDDTAGNVLANNGNGTDTLMERLP
jgi:hypothetical protein